MSEPKPTPGIDTPAEDDIITPCAGGCGRWMVSQHPRHITAVGYRDQETGGFKERALTPQEVEERAARIEDGGSSCLSCGPVRR